MALLHPPPALQAAAHSDVEAAHHGPPDNLFLILCFAALRLHAPAAMRAVRRQWNRDSLIHSRRNRTAPLPAIAPARFAPRSPRVGFRFAAGMRCGLPLAGA